jgi:hypothetical protein
MAIVSTEYARSRSSERTTADGSERVALKRLLWAGPLGVALAAAANEVARRAAIALVTGASADYLALDASAVLMMTVLFTVAAVGVFAAIARLSIQPIRTYQIVAVVALALSVLPDLMLLNEPGTTGGDVVALIVLHAVAALAVSYTLCRYARAA